MAKKSVVVYVQPEPDRRDREIAAQQQAIEDSGMRVVGEPVVTMVPNQDYIEEPDAPELCYRVEFEVEADGDTGEVIT